ncbi:MAG: AAA family ATPase [Muribaculaceae bacterium]|nr:AAA family ATPase [Muribaculaceae bacterium]
MEKQPQKPLRIPYGMQNWEAVRLEGYYYVDKTRFIPEIEANNNYFFFIRPRRFGKSMLLNMLTQYYDIKKRHLFDRLFGDLWIGSHPTEARNSYLVLSLNFSAITGGLEDYQQRLYAYCNEQFKRFAEYYADLLPSDTLTELQASNDAALQLNTLANLCYSVGQKIYLFIDEYDHFTNAILADAATESSYKAETHGTGVYRRFFNMVKDGTGKSISRMFVTGVSPVTMDDLTSGFNIATNYTTDPEFNAMVGFTEHEVRQMLDYYRQHYTFRHTTDQLIDIMKPWYDNYCFAEECLDEPPMYNSDMVLYFMSHYLRSKNIPRDMLDQNIRTDYNKMRMLIRKDRGFDNNASIIQYIVETGGIVADLKKSFPSEDIPKQDNFISLLYYFGMLTIAGRYRGSTKLRIPNQVVREQMYGYLTQNYRTNELATDDMERERLMKNMAYDGDWRPFFDNIARAIARYSSNRDKAKGEAYVHGFTLAQTCLTKLYLPVSELDAGAKTYYNDAPLGGYADIYMQPMLEIYPDIEHSFVLELKYVPGNATDAEVEQASRQAHDQLLRYERSVVIERTLGHTRLHRLVLVWRGIELAVAQEL